MTTLADNLDAQALTLRHMAATALETGDHVDVPWERGTRKPLHMLTPDDILADAEALEADAAKLRLLY